MKSLLKCFRHFQRGWDVRIFAWSGVRVKASHWTCHLPLLSFVMFRVEVEEHIFLCFGWCCLILGLQSNYGSWLPKFYEYGMFYEHGLKGVWHIFDGVDRVCVCV